MKKRKLFGILMLTGVLLTGCGGSAGSKSAEMDSYSVNATAETADAGTYDSAAAMDGVGEGTEMATEEVPADQGEDTATVSERKLIKTVNLDAETKTFDTFSENLEKMVTEMKGYIEYSDVSGESDDEDRYASYTIRIPENQLEAFISGMDENLNITRKSESVEDITLTYVDTQSRIDSLKTEQETLNGMLASAETVEDLIAIQSRLSEVRYQLESYESQLRSYDNQINYSTVNLSVQEVERESKTGDASFMSQLKERLSDNLCALKNSSRSLALWFLSSIPFFLIIAVVVLIIVFLCKKVAKHTSKKTVSKGSMVGIKENIEKPIEEKTKTDKEEPPKEE